MIASARFGLILSCVAVLGQSGFAQTQTQTPPAEQTTQTPPAKPQKTGPTGADPDLATGDGAFSIQLSYWLTKDAPELFGGKKKTTIDSGDLSSIGKAKYTPGAIISIPLLKENTIRLSYFRTTGKSDTTAPADLNIYSTGFAQGDFLTSSYTLQAFKISLDYLSYPYPLRGSKFRFKTLWEVQYVSINSRVSAPLLVDSTGAADPITVTAKKTIILPTFGLAVERSFNRNFRVEASASGFTLPGKSTIWDAEGAAAFRAGRIEILVGAKAFHFRTSPNADNYIVGTLKNGFVGLRYYWQ